MGERAEPKQRVSSFFLATALGCVPKWQMNHWGLYKNLERMTCTGHVIKASGKCFLANLFNN
jgi:hypothetical protein